MFGSLREITSYEDAILRCKVGTYKCYMLTIVRQMAALESADTRLAVIAKLTR